MSSQCLSVGYPDQEGCSASRTPQDGHLEDPFWTFVLHLPHTSILSTSSFLHEGHTLSFDRVLAPHEEQNSYDWPSFNILVLCRVRPLKYANVMNIKRRVRNTIESAQYHLGSPNSVEPLCSAKASFMVKLCRNVTVVPSPLTEMINVWLPLSSSLNVPS